MSFITSLIISIQWHRTDEFKGEREREIHCVRYGRSLWSANQLPAQRVNHSHEINVPEIYLKHHLGEWS